jgi:hypothetical protein
MNSKMKLLLTFIALAYACSSCGLILSAGRKRVAVIDAPPDLKITDLRTGEPLEIKMKITRGDSYVGANRTTNIAYKTPSINISKVQKGDLIEIESQGVKKTVSFGTKPNIGILAIETVFTLGTFTIIDLVLGTNKSFKPPHIDVPAVLAGKPQRSEKEINQYIRENSH